MPNRELSVLHISVDQTHHTRRQDTFCEKVARCNSRLYAFVSSHVFSVCHYAMLTIIFEARVIVRDGYFFTRLQASARDNCKAFLLLDLA
jgi:hypothetical protein